MKQKDYKVELTEEKKEKIIEMIQDYVERHGYGECIAQSDSAIIDGAILLPDIADILEPIYIGEN